MLTPIAGPPYRSEPIVMTAAVLGSMWLLGVVGVYDAGAAVHVLLVGAILLGAVAAFTRAR